MPMAHGSKKGDAYAWSWLPVCSDSCALLECHTGFELCTVLSPLCRHRPASPLPLLWTQHSILITCPVFGIHYKDRRLVERSAQTCYCNLLDVPSLYSARRDGRWRYSPLAGPQTGRKLCLEDLK